MGEVKPAVLFEATKPDETLMGVHRKEPKDGVLGLNTYKWEDEEALAQQAREVVSGGRRAWRESN